MTFPSKESAGACEIISMGDSLEPALPENAEKAKKGLEMMDAIISSPLSKDQNPGPRTLKPLTVCY
ncbi:MAG TPA: hypothetical protein VIG33_18345 [Pseudobdellovibrionaceae bacterium]